MMVAATSQLANCQISEPEVILRSPRFSCASLLDPITHRQTDVPRHQGFL